MDTRWEPYKLDSKRYIKVLLHQTASISEVRRGTNANPPLDFTPYTREVSQSAFECQVTFAFNRELFGDNQPAPHQIIEIQLKQRASGDDWRPVWMGDVVSLSSFNMSRGERTMQLIAKTREQQDIWKYTKRMTPLFPMMTDLGYIATRIARSAGMLGDEIMLPFSSIKTAHSNTQLADMNAWDMMSTIFTALGWTPFIDNLGRLRAADRNLQARDADIVLDESALIKVHGSRVQPPVSRVKLSWMNPLRKKKLGQGRILGSPYTLTIGWFIPRYKHEFFFSEDQTQRAVVSEVKPNPSANLFGWAHFVDEKWKQPKENAVMLSWTNWQPAWIAGTLITWGLERIGVFDVGVSSPTGGPVPVISPVGRLLDYGFNVAIIAEMMLVGIGIYEVWGVPYEWIFPQNITEAFDDTSPTWVDNSAEFENNFVTSEEHAQGIAVRELIYQARQASQWSATIVDDPRIEFGDILEFPDGEKLYVEDFTRSMERGGDAVLDVKGFLLGPPAIPGGAIDFAGSPPDIDEGGGGGDGGGDDGGLDPEGPAIVGDASENNTCETAFEVPAVEGEYVSHINTSGNLTDPTEGFGGVSPAYHAAWWKFTSPGNGTMTINLAESGYDTQLAVFRGSCGDFVLAGYNDDQGIAKTSFLEVPTPVGETLFFLVSGTNPHAGGPLNFITYYNAI